MKGDVYISTVMGRLETVLSIVKDYLVKVIDPIPDICDEAMVLISVTDEEWTGIKAQLLKQ